MGEGFDFRMNLGLQSLLQHCPSLHLDCFLIQYDEGRSSASKRYKPFVKENRDVLNSLVKPTRITEKKIDLWSAEGKRKKRVGDQNVASLFDDPQLFQPYTDIFVDISALPRGIYFSLVGKIQAMLDQYFAAEEKNFFLVTAENAGLDAKIKDYQPDSELSYVFGYRGGSELTSDKKQTIWLPILGEGMAYQIAADPSLTLHCLHCWQGGQSDSYPNQESVRCSAHCRRTHRSTTWEGSKPYRSKSRQELPSPYRNK